MINALKALLSLSALLLLFWQCSSDTLYRSNQHAIQVGLSSIYTKKDTMPKLSAYGLGREDSLIYDTIAVKELFLPLKFDIDSTIYVIKILQRSDTVIFYHTKEQIYISDEDGFTFNMYLTKIAFTTNIIDSAAFLNPAIIYNETLQNVKLYLR